MSCARRHGCPRLRHLAITAALLTLAACATYRPAPLATAPNLRTRLANLDVDVSQLRLEPLRSVAIDPRSGLTPLDVAVLAVLNDPDLKSKRAALGVADAQVFAAGLLPDPQVTANLDQPIAGPDTHTAYGVSPSYDLAGLLASITNRRAARDSARQVRLDLLWAEWSAAQQARGLAETALANESRAAFLSEILAAAADRSQRSQQALAHGDVTAQTAAADLAAKLDVQAQLDATRQAALKARRDLNALLGLDASVSLPLIEAPTPAPADPAQMRRDLALLPTRRPDLLALQAGYGAQDAKLRQAIVAQFPLTQIAVAYARDPTPTTTVGLSAVLALPIFNGHRGDVKIAEATREQLRADYQARLDQADAQVKDAAATLVSAEAQASTLRADLPRLEAMLGPAPAALARGDIDSQAYLGLLQAVINKRADLADRELAARMAEITLETALFIPPLQTAHAS